MNSLDCETAVERCSEMGNLLRGEGGTGICLGAVQNGQTGGGQFWDGQLGECVLGFGCLLRVELGHIFGEMEAQV